MFRWIWSNKDWLFSGVGLALILLIARFVFRRIKKAKPEEDLVKGPSLQQIIEGPPAKPPEIKKESTSSSLSALAIIASINATPLLQRPDVARNYIGLRVTWDGQLSSAKKISDDKIRLIIRISEGFKDVRAVCEINPNEYPGLALLKYEHLVRVSGVISRIEDYFNLEDAHIEYDLGSLDN